MKKAIFGAVVGCLIFIFWFWSAFVASEAGSCDSLRDLPVYGKKLPSVNSACVEYYADKQKGVVVAQTSINRDDYIKMCSNSELFIHQSREFDLRDRFHKSPYNRFKLSENNEEYILHAAGDFGDGGRAVVRYYFESPAKDSDMGKLIVHIS